MVKKRLFCSLMKKVRTCKASHPVVVVPLQVRCAAVFALGTFVGNSAERTDHSTTIDHNVAMMLAQLINDGSPVVRKVTAAQQHSRKTHSSSFYSMRVIDHPVKCQMKLEL